MSKDGALFEWNFVAKLTPDDETSSSDPKELWRIINRHFFMQSNAHVCCASFHPASNLLVVGFSNGIFTLHELPDFVMLHSLSISQTDVDCDLC